MVITTILTTRDHGPSLNSIFAYQFETIGLFVTFLSLVAFQLGSGFLPSGNAYKKQAWLYNKKIIIKVFLRRGVNGPTSSGPNPKI